MKSETDEQSVCPSVQEICPQSMTQADGFGLVTNLAYLARCQVDTPPEIVSLMWRIVEKYRSRVGKVFDAGAGDGRFSIGGNYETYVGYELDGKRIPVESLPSNANILRSDAFALSEPFDFDLAIGNPPYARHHDLSDAWRDHVASWISSHTDVRPNGWSNAYLYFMWLALIATKQDGLVAHLVPFDWVTRPAAKSLRDYISSCGWKLDIYRFDNEPFSGVLTTACISVVDKRGGASTSYYRIAADNSLTKVLSPTLSSSQPLEYKKSIASAYARRGLSPGDQKVFMLDESRRKEHNLEVGSDVIPAVASFKEVDSTQMALTEKFFQRHFVDAGVRCWLINPSDTPSDRLLKYLDFAGVDCKENTTCASRAIWWKFVLPPKPSILYASGFSGKRPKFMLNEIGAIAVGAVCGIYTDSKFLARHVFHELIGFNFAAQVVALSGGFTKVEINQMNAAIQSVIE
jgi:hypothetical protein